MSNCMNEKWRPTLLSGSKSSTFCRRRMNQKYRKTGKTFLRYVESSKFELQTLNDVKLYEWEVDNAHLVKALPQLPYMSHRSGPAVASTLNMTHFCFVFTKHCCKSHCQSLVWALLCIGGAPLASRFDGREAFCSAVCSCAQAGGLTQTDKLNRSELLRASLHHWTSRSQVPKPLLKLLVQLYSGSPTSY